MYNTMIINSRIRAIAFMAMFLARKDTESAQLELKLRKPTKGDLIPGIFGI